MFTSKIFRALLVAIVIVVTALLWVIGGQASAPADFFDPTTTPCWIPSSVTPPATNYTPAPGRPTPETYPWCTQTPTPKSTDVVAGPNPQGTPVPGFTLTPSPTPQIGVGVTNPNVLYIPYVSKKVYTIELVLETATDADTESPVIGAITCTIGGTPCPTHDPNDPTPTLAPTPMP